MLEGENEGFLQMRKKCGLRARVNSKYTFEIGYKFF